MLSKSEVGLQGLHALFKSYQLHFGSDAATLAQKYGYRICIEQVPMYHGQLVHEERRIIVSQEGPEVSREFVVFHEMAHHFLHGIAPIFNQEVLPSDQADDIEYWCDHFALAMFFAKRKARLMDEQSYESFLTHGNEAAYDGRDSISPWRQSALLSRRIPHMTRTFFKPKDMVYKECVVLQHALLLVSKLVWVREAED